MGATPNTVGMWRKRFAERRFEGLHDEPRPGAPREIGDDEIAQIVRRTLEETPPGATHWSLRSMAAACGHAPSTVHAIWRAFGLQPHRSDTFKLSTDPQFVEKVRDIVGLYLDPPKRAMVLCVDEKSQIQALDRSQRKEDAAALGALAPTHEPRAVGHIDGVIRMITALIDRGHAYAVEDGDVLYSVRSFEDYGKLSGRKPDELRSGGRVATDERKHDPLDFALWKRAKPGEPSWHSPWGDGRPGWHIECSAMSTALLGEEFDIHGGGLDLQFPHHENEIAQSEAASGKGFARYWMHNGMVRVDGEKMSKSLGNFLTVRDALREWRGEELRFFVVASHYRSPIEIGDEPLAAARRALRGLYTALRGHPVQADATSDPSFTARFEAAMDDDLNTSGAIAVLHELAGRVNGARQTLPDDSDEVLVPARTLRALGARLGLLQGDAEAYLQGADRSVAAGQMEAAEVETLIGERLAARRAGRTVHAAGSAVP